ncbi:MAG TPA: HEXXH motif domain-containing protein [Actinophytocola sp.]|uniref:HEXXH motif domain-containing protein n=1 Tax=Actinophytocola sp. TaxID=1872138 RepID=UPI002DC012A3|nr:HEXXH motif domain-containing protein [Actinophytocola sp.]HEU5470528.1 HEXXH motif domain-containing protein [Actinophytocola sp.]
MGYFHALAASAAIQAGIGFAIRVPVWEGTIVLPTLGVAQLPMRSRFSVAEVRGDAGGVRVGAADLSLTLPVDLSTDAPGWWAIRRIEARDAGRLVRIRLDDVDPYRGMHEPLLPKRIDADAVRDWEKLLAGAWHLMLRCVPAVADGFAEGFDAVVPIPAVPYKSVSGSAGEAFGSATIALPADATSLAAMLVHEFQHFKLGALMHLTALTEADCRERFYTQWRDDPRPIGGVLHGVYAFFGVTAFWRGLATVDTQATDERAWFEFGYWRAGVARTLDALRADGGLTEIGRRFVDGIAGRLEPWLREPIPDRTAGLVDAATVDHHAGWRMRHVRPDKETVRSLTIAWLSGKKPAPVALDDQAPTPVPDGTWSGARTELVRLALTIPAPSIASVWQEIPGATRADFDYATGRAQDAVRSYRAELATDQDSPNAWVGLGLALRAAQVTSPAARALLGRPELVRAVHREVRRERTVDPVELAEWISPLVR